MDSSAKHEEPTYLRKFRVTFVLPIEVEVNPAVEHQGFGTAEEIAKNMALAEIDGFVDLFEENSKGSGDKCLADLFESKGSVRVEEVSQA